MINVGASLVGAQRPRRIQPAESYEGNHKGLPLQGVTPAEIETLIGDGDGAQSRIVTGVGTQIDA